MRFEDLHIRMELSIKAEDNPRLGLPDELRTRRGITVCGPISAQQPADFDHLVRLMTLEMRGGLRALKHRLQEDGYVEKDT